MEANHEQEYPRPPSLPADQPWPPDFDLYRDKTDRKAKSHECSEEAFNEDLAREAFGKDYLDKLIEHQKHFTGDWWQLAFLTLAVEAAKEAERTDEYRLAVWNRFRLFSGDSGIRIHLAHANLRGADLAHANLIGALLERANLEEAHLAHARLIGAHLAHAGLIGADLEHADLRFADLAHAHLIGAHLERADLWEAHLEHANLVDALLERANLEEAHLAHANLVDADLEHVGLYGTDLRLAKIENAQLNHCPPEDWSWWKAWRHRLTDWLDWDRVRKVGRLQLLTRASYWALLGVPILSALWGPARMWISTMNGAMDETRSELTALQRHMSSDEQIVTSLQAVEKMLADGTLASTLPLSLLLAFCAAFCMAVGHFIYQVFAPQLIAEHSEADLVEQAEEINRRDQNISDERLRQAISHLKSAAFALPHRCHAWLVKRDRRVVWLPHDLDWYADAETEESSSTEKPQQEVTGEDRKRIAIEEGERAKYRQAAYEKRSWAWVSGNLYIVGGLLLLAIVLIQLGHVSQAAGAGAWLGRLGWVGQNLLVWLSAFWFLLFPIAGVVALNWERMRGWFRD